MLFAWVSKQVWSSSEFLCIYVFIYLKSLNANLHQLQGKIQA